MFNLRRLYWVCEKITSVWKEKIVAIVSYTWSVRNDSGIIILDYEFGTYAAERTDSGYNLVDCTATPEVIW